MREHTIYLVNSTCSPSRDEIINSDRKIGECFFKPLDLRFCGYSIVEGTGKLAAQWDLPAEKINEAIDFIGTHSLDGYSAQLWIGCYKQFETNAGKRHQDFSRRVA